MPDKIFIKRHENKNITAASEVVSRQYIISILNINDIKNKNLNANTILIKLIQKKLFIFDLCYNGMFIGLICIDDIDWENRNCRIKCGLLEDYVKMISLDLIKELIKDILNFCKNELRLNRVWGVISNDETVFIKVLEEYFDLEGMTISKNILYYGCLL